ncbi:MAG: protein kinase domain-containing protein [Janthinobacterium lividum]
MLKQLHVLGHGGFGVVDAVLNEKGEKFARKTFQISAPTMAPALQVNVLKRFRREVNAQQSLKHKNIVKILEAHTSSAPPYYLMPLAERSLHDDLVADRSLNGKYLRAIMDILAGLEEMHDLEMYHRDLKPRNILRYKDESGEDYYAIGDFGFVSLNESRVSTLTSTDMALGEDFYVAPELAISLHSGKAPADIYAVGCILHNMVGTSKRMFMDEIKEDGPFGDIMSKCTRKDPNKRFQSVEALREAILSVSEADRSSVLLSKNALIQALASDKKLDAPTWNRIEHYLVHDIESPPYELSADSQAMLRLLSRDRIDEIYALDEDVFTSISSVYATWARNYSFNFEFCDTLASRLEHMITLGNLSLRTECIMALLYLGADHNRFYVERVFARNADGRMDDRLAQRVVIEFRGDGRKACDAIRHLERSIYLNTATLHPRLVSVLASIC